MNDVAFSVFLRNLKTMQIKHDNWVRSVQLDRYVTFTNAGRERLVHMVLLDKDRIAVAPDLAIFSKRLAPEFAEMFDLLIKFHWTSLGLDLFIQGLNEIKARLGMNITADE